MFFQNRIWKMCTVNSFQSIGLSVCKEVDFVDFENFMYVVKDMYVYKGCVVKCGEY